MGAKKDTTPARNTEEFIEKYKNKRFTPANTGKAYLLSFLFDAYQANSLKIATTWWNLELLKSKIKTEEDMRSFDSYYYLTEWLRSLYENAVAMRNALRSVVSDFSNIMLSIIAGENIRREVKDIKSDTLPLWLSTITIEGYTPQRPGSIQLQSLRENIGQGIRYIKAYHTFLDVIAEFTGIPECVFLKVRISQINDSLSALNEALECLRDDVAKYREPEIKRNYIINNKLETLRESIGISPETSASDPETTPSDPHTSEKEQEPDKIPTIKLTVHKSEWAFPDNSLTRWTPDYLKETMKYFMPIREEPPVPEERIQYLKNAIRRDFGKEIINWYNLYSMYSIKYRIPRPAVTPPTGFNLKKQEGE